MKSVNQLAMLVLIQLMLFISPARGQTYNDTHSLFKDLLTPDIYHPRVRPRNDQSKPVTVIADFHLVSIMDINDVTQTFVCNGAFTLRWMDERLQWDPGMYGRQRVIHPLASQVWRPRLILMNTMGEQDLFDDQLSQIDVEFTGSTTWVLGNLYTVYCRLNLENYPFDNQICSVKMISMGFDLIEVIFTAGESHKVFYSVNGEWEVLGSEIRDSALEVNANHSYSVIEVTFDLARRPTFFLLNIILPVALLSILNNFVFFIPVSSGERIAYGMTVVLAMTVFLSIMSAMLPSSATPIPHVTFYLFSLLVISAVTLMVSIIDHYLWHLEQAEDQGKQPESKFNDDTANLQNFKTTSNNAVYPVTTPTTNGTNIIVEEGMRSIAGDPKTAIASMNFRSTSRNQSHYCSSCLLRDPNLIGGPGMRNGEAELAKHIREENAVNDKNVNTHCKEDSLKRTKEDGSEKAKGAENMHRFYRLKLETGSAFSIVIIWLGATIWFFASVL